MSPKLTIKGVAGDVCAAGEPREGERQETAEKQGAVVEQGMGVRQGAVVERATLADLDAILAIERGCFAEDAFSRRQLAYLIHRAQGGTYVARITGRIAGYISLLTRRTTDNVRIYSVAVAAEARGHGVGQILVDQAIAQAHRQRLHEVTLEVRTDNTAALALYVRKGFVPDKLLRSYYHDGTDARRMVLRLE